MSGHLRALLERLADSAELWHYKLVMKLDGYATERDYWHSWSAPMPYEQAIAELSAMKLNGEIKEVVEI